MGVARLRYCMRMADNGGGIDFAIEATELISSLGHWPQARKDVLSRAMRVETRLANWAAAWCAVRAVDFKAAPELQALMALRNLHQSEATALVFDRWCGHCRVDVAAVWFTCSGSVRKPRFQICSYKAPQH